MKFIDNRNLGDEWMAGVAFFLLDFGCSKGQIGVWRELVVPTNVC